MEVVRVCLYKYLQASNAYSWFLFSVMTPHFFFFKESLHVCYIFDAKPTIWSTLLKKRNKIDMHRTARTSSLSATAFINIYIFCLFFTRPFYHEDILVSLYFYRTFVLLPVCFKCLSCVSL